MTPDTRYLLVSNYMDGTIGVCRADENGMNVVQTDLVRRGGKEQQIRRGRKAPMLIRVSLIMKRYIPPDLGLDTIFVYQLNPTDGKLGGM